MSGEKRSWRDAVEVHPAAEVFPLMTLAELRDLANDVKRNGLQSGAVFYLEAETGRERLLDGRNRLDALELAGIEVVGEDEKIKREFLAPPLLGGLGVGDPVAYVIGANIRRRHLSKRQQADLIVAAVKAGNDERAKLARSRIVGSKPGTRSGGSTKDPVKQQVVEIAAEQGISERTVTRALVAAEPERRRAKPVLVARTRRVAPGDLKQALRPQGKTLREALNLPRKTVEAAPPHLQLSDEEIEAALEKAADGYAAKLSRLGRGTALVKLSVTFSEDGITLGATSGGARRRA